MINIIRSLIFLLSTQAIPLDLSEEPKKESSPLIQVLSMNDTNIQEDLVTHETTKNCCQRLDALYDRYAVHGAILGSILISATIFFILYFCAPAIQ